MATMQSSAVKEHFRMLFEFKSKFSKFLESPDDVDSFRQIVAIWMKARTFLPQYGFETPDIILVGRSRKEIASDISEFLLSKEFLFKIKEKGQQIETDEIVLGLMQDTSEDNALISDEFFRPSAHGRDHIQQQINALRDAVAASDWTAESHKTRVLKKINILQLEFDKPVSDFERIVGGFVNVGNSIGLFAEGAKPAVDASVRVIEALNGEKRESNLLTKDDAPKQIEDLRDEGK